MPAAARDRQSTRSLTARPTMSKVATLAETETALSCLKQWWQLGAPQRVTLPGIGMIDLTEMLKRLSADVELGIRIIGQDEVSAVARKFGMKVTLDP